MSDCFINIRNNDTLNYFTNNCEYKYLCAKTTIIHAAQTGRVALTANSDILTIFVSIIAQGTIFIALVIKKNFLRQTL